MAISSIGNIFQWLNIAIILRSVSSFGTFIVMIELILNKFTLLLLMIFPLLIGFSISASMIFYHQSSLMTVARAMHKISIMMVGEFDYEILFFFESNFSRGCIYIYSIDCDYDTGIYQSFIRHYSGRY